MHTVATFFIVVVVVIVIVIVVVLVSGNIRHKRIGEGIIDDTGLSASFQLSIKIISTQQKRFTADEDAIFAWINKMIQFFLELLQGAGDDLNLSTCACFTFFTAGLEDPPPHQESSKASNARTLTTRTAPSDGCMMTADGKSTAQFKVLKSKANLFAGGIGQSRMQRYDAITAYN
jgi:hypothetical protein